MNDEAPVRDRGGNLVVGCGALLGIGLPIWLLVFVLFQSAFVQAVAAQVMPGLRGMDGADEVARALVWQLNTNPMTLAYSFLVATAVTLPLLGVAAAIVSVAGLLSGMSQRVWDRSARQRYQDLVGEVVLADDAYPARPISPVPDPPPAPVEEANGSS